MSQLGKPHVAALVRGVLARVCATVCWGGPLVPGQTRNVRRGSGWAGPPDPKTTLPHDWAVLLVIGSPLGPEHLKCRVRPFAVGFKGKPPGIRRSRSKDATPHAWGPGEECQGCGPGGKGLYNERTRAGQSAVPKERPSVSEGTHI